jgi:hypothetical protein
MNKSTVEVKNKRFFIAERGRRLVILEDFATESADETAKAEGMAALDVSDFWR